MSALVKSRHVQRTSRCPLGAKSGHSSVRCVVHTTVPFSYAESDNLTEHLNCSRLKRAEPESQCLLRYDVVVNQAAHRARRVGAAPACSRVLVIWSALIVTAVWSIATGAYFAFRGDVIHSMTEMQATYDKRIADLRGEFDRVVSEQFLDQERIQHQLNVLLQ